MASQDYFYYSDDVSIVLGTVSILIEMTVISVTGKFIYDFWRYGRELTIMKKRHFNVTILMSIGFWLSGLFVGGIIINQSNIFNASETGSSNILRRLTLLIAIIGIEIATYTCAFRFWMIYFDTHISEMAESNNWKLLINPNLNIKKINNWFLQHNNCNFYRNCYVCNIVKYLCVTFL